MFLPLSEYNFWYTISNMLTSQMLFDLYNNGKKIIQNSTRNRLTTNNLKTKVSSRVFVNSVMGLKI